MRAFWEERRVILLEQTDVLDVRTASIIRVVIYLPTKFHMLSCSGSFVIAVKFKTK
jgi:hypothetical protein